MHCLAQRAHRAPPATRTRARWQPYNAFQCNSARSSPVAYLNTPASSVASAPPTPPQAPAVCEHERLQNVIPSSATLHGSGQLVRDTHKNKYVSGLVDQAVKSLCEIWQPHDIPTSFMKTCRTLPAAHKSHEILNPIATKGSMFGTRNTQLPSPISPSTQPSPISPQFLPAANAGAQPDLATSQSSLVPLKGFVHEVLRRSRTSGTVLQTALCYLEAVRSKVPGLIAKEKAGMGVQGESDQSGRITLGDLEVEEWHELSLDSVMADFIHLDAVVDSENTQMDTTATVKVTDSDELLQSASSADSQMLSSNSDLGLSGLKSHLIQIAAKKPKVPSGPLLPLTPLPSPLLCPRRTFLASLILASKFTQDRCYSNKAWAKLSGLPPREIGRCERALGDALDWRLWVGKTSDSSNRAVVRSKSDSELFDTSSQTTALAAPRPTNSKTSLSRSTTLPAMAFSDESTSVPPSFPEVAWETLPWPQVNAAPPSSSSSSSSSPSTPSLSYSPTSTESSSGDRTIQMPGFFDTASSPKHAGSIGVEKPVGLSFSYLTPLHGSVDVGLHYSLYAQQGVNGPYVHNPPNISGAGYANWTE